MIKELLKDLHWKKGLFIVVIIIPFYWFIGVMAMAYKTPMEIKGFAVDSFGKIYIGNEYNIVAYDNTNVKTKIIETHDSYAFTILEDDTILLAESYKVYSMDLNGNIFSEKTEDDKETYEYLRKEWKEFLAADGSIYRIKNKNTRYRIVRTFEGVEETVYKMPLFDFIVRIQRFLAAPLLFIFIGGFLFRNYNTKFLKDIRRDSKLK